MKVGAVLIAIGVAVWVTMYGFKALFVNRADKMNPYSKLVAVVGYLGLAIAGWGLILVVFAG